MEQDLTFKEQKGTPANEHAKKLAKQKVKKSKYETVYSQNGSKIVKVTFKPNGAYQEYIGNYSKKKEQSILKAEIAKWKKEGVWVDEHSIKEYASKKIAALNK